MTVVGVVARLAYLTERRVASVLVSLALAGVALLATARRLAK